MDDMSNLSKKMDEVDNHINKYNQSFNQMFNE